MDHSLTDIAGKESTTHHSKPSAERVPWRHGDICIMGIGNIRITRKVNEIKNESKFKWNDPSKLYREQIQKICSSIFQCTNDCTQHNSKDIVDSGKSYRGHLRPISPLREKCEDERLYQYLSKRRKVDRKKRRNGKRKGIRKRNERKGPEGGRGNT